MMRRTIGLIITYALALLVAPLAADCASAAKVPRIGVLVFIAFGPNPNLEAFRRILHALGWVVGQNIAIEYRWGEERLDRLRDHAAELVRLNVDVIVASSSPAVQAARQATQTIPIVALDMETDPVASGLAASFARPGGNLTGVFLDQPALSGKWLELLREAVPDVTRVAVLWDAGINPEPLRATEGVAQSLRLPLHILEVRGPHEFERAFDAATRDRARALLVCQSPMFSVHQTRIADLAASRQLPTIAMFREVAQAGVLLSYGPNIQEVFRRAAIYVDKILKGTRPGDLSIERATTFELVINLKTAEALGLTIPPTLLFQATEVIR
jgi:putative tryptophan/tyrosine transport system substrate-binding protein